MKKLIIVCLLYTITHTQAQTAGQVIESVIDAMGGAAWQNITYIRSKHVGHKHWLEQSENPSGPFITSYEVVEELRAVREQQLQRKESSHMFQSKTANQSEIILNGERGLMKFGDRSFPLPHQLLTGHEEWLRYAPERLVLDAQKADLTFQGETPLEGTPHLVLSYTLNGLEHTLFVNKHTRVLTQAQIETYLPTDIFNYPWGKFVTTIKYSLHWLYDGGIRYPAQWDVYKLGKKFRSSTIIDIDFQPVVPEETFAIPEGLPQVPPAVKVNDLPLNTDGLVKMGDHVHTIPGMWYVGHIEQEDGILVIEAPISSGYNEQHLAFLSEKYPNKPIKAVFATSDAWPHVGGIRAFPTQNIPVYTHALNEDIIRSVLAADHSPQPDAYEKNKLPVDFRFIKEPIWLEDSKAPVQILPVNGEGGERMIMLYLPRQKVLYASDLVQYSGRKKEKFFSPQYLSEVKSVVDRYELEVETVFAMHTSPVAWQKVTEALKAFEK